MQCLEVAEQACINQGGVYLGDGTRCDEAVCVPGACCLFDVDDLSSGAPGPSPTPCVPVIESACISMGGVFQGTGTPCAPFTCDTAACCLPQGGCTVTTQTGCEALGGEYLPQVSLCIPGICDPAACCLSDGSCVVRTQFDCTGLGGVFFPNSPTCDKAPCEQPPQDTACCLPDGTCLLYPTETLCIAAGGAPQAPGVACAAVDCPVLIIACCYPDGSCQQSLEEDCTADGGAPQPAPFDCGAVTCGDVEVACCLPDGSCVVMTADDCAAAGGSGQPFPADCGPVQCVQPPFFGCCMPDGSCQLFATATLCIAAGGEPGPPDVPCEQLNCPPPPCTLPGRPDPNDPASGERVLRGYILGYAVDTQGREIRWNHLSAGATSVDYLRGSALEIPAATFPTTDIVIHGAPLPGPGVLDLDGVEYAAPPAALLLHFAADGSTSFSSTNDLRVASTELTLMPMDISFADGALPPVTKAEFEIWNENETKLSGTYRCITCWDSTVLASYHAVNHLVIAALQTDRGKARIRGVASPLCPESLDRALIGVSARRLDDGATQSSATGSILTSVGYGSGTIIAPAMAPPDEAPGAHQPREPRALRRRPARAQRAPTSGIARADVSADAGAAFTDEPEGGSEAPGVAGPVSPIRMGTDKGSLFVIPRVEIRWDAAGNLIGDTFIHLTNDYPQDVLVQMWFVNGDPEGVDQYGCFHPGWNFVDVLIGLTRDQPVWWSALSGQPAGVSPFTVLDP